MFVAVVCELGNDDHVRDVHALLKQYGFEQVFRDVFESVTIKENLLPRLKRDIDRLTDSYDRVRMYQFPVDNTLAVTSLQSKKWRKMVLRQ